MVGRQRKEQVIGRGVMFIVVAMLLAAAGACEFNAPPDPDSDSEQSYNSNGYRIPVDDNVYTVSGQVVADVETMTRQTAPAHGSYSDYSGSYFGAQFGGKGFVRLLVKSVSPPSRLAEPGRIVLIKTSDTKAAALLPKDLVTFRCRAQYEAVAAVRVNEDFDPEKTQRVATWELDYCRMETPVVSVSP